MQFARLVRCRAGLAPAALLGQHLGHWGQPASCQEEESSSSSSGAASLLRVSYMSTMRGDATSARKDIERIVEQSIPANCKAKLSGHMCYDARLKIVWQVIEGRGDIVNEKWDRIRADARHAIDEDTVSVEPVESRRYPVGWGLRFTTFDDALPLSPRATEAGRKHEVEVRDGQLMQLAYKSTIVEHNGEEMNAVRKLVPHAMVNNAKKSITGWMMYNDRTLTVYQILEGPKDAVEGLWRRICQDPRHVVIADSVRRRAIDYREFPNWSMAMDEVKQPPWSAQGY